MWTEVIKLWLVIKTRLNQLPRDKITIIPETVVELVERPLEGGVAFEQLDSWSTRWPDLVAPTWFHKSLLKLVNPQLIKGWNDLPTTPNWKRSVTKYFKKQLSNKAHLRQRYNKPFWQRCETYLQKMQKILCDVMNLLQLICIQICHQRFNKIFCLKRDPSPALN